MMFLRRDVEHYFNDCCGNMDWSVYRALLRETGDVQDVRVLSQVCDERWMANEEIAENC
jgi:hypothetical protein